MGNQSDYLLNNLVAMEIFQRQHIIGGELGHIEPTILHNI